jgi:hypothetical protein
MHHNEAGNHEKKIDPDRSVTGAWQERIDLRNVRCGHHHSRDAAEDLYRHYEGGCLVGKRGRSLKRQNLRHYI